MGTFTVGVIVLESYRAKIDRMITLSNAEIALNGSFDHAAIVVERMLSRASVSVSILTKNFNKRIYCDDLLLDSARGLLSSPSKCMRILIEDWEEEAAKNSPYLLEFRRYPNFDIRQVPEHLKGPVKVNFALMDDSGFRLEKDQTGTTAVVCFGELDLAKKLGVLFDDIWAKSKKFSFDI